MLFRKPRFRRLISAAAPDGVLGGQLVDSWNILGAALQADGEYEVRGNGLKHQKEKRSMEHFAGLDVSVKETSVCIVDDAGRIVKGSKGGELA